MSRLVFVIFIIFINSVKSKSFLDVMTSGFKSTQKSTDTPGMNSLDTDSQYLAKEDFEVNMAGDEYEDLNDLELDLINSDSSQASTSLKRMTTEKEFLDYLLSIYQPGFDSYRENFQNEEPGPVSPLMRREINNWKRFHEFIEPESISWNYESHDSLDGDPYQQNYFDKNTNLKNFIQLKNNSFLNGHPPPTKNGQKDSEFPQYVQKNYYNNFYILIPSGKPATVWSSGESVNAEKNNLGLENFNERKLIRKNDCRQYLQFLKYAFQKLDEEPYYYYDDNEQYGNNVIDQAKTPNHPPFQTHLLGPTMYVDNSGKISQSSLHGTSFQSIEGASAGPKFTSISPNEFKLSSTITTNEDWKSSFQYKNTYYEPTTTEADPTKSNNNTEFNTTPSLNKIGMNWRFGPYGSDILRRSGNDDFETTAATDEKEIYSSENPAYTTTYSSKNPTPEVNYQTSEETTVKKMDDLSLMNIFTGTSNSTYRQFPHWFTLADFHTSQPTAAPPSISWMPRNGPDTTEVPDTMDLTKNEEDPDCNDKMLPCPDTVNVTYPLNGYCNRYVTCESGKAIRRVCSDGLHFNIITKSCDLPHNSICTYACPEPNGIYGIPGDCGGYFVCKNSVLEYRMCPPKMHWDINRGKCIFEEMSSCPMKCFGDNEIRSYEGDCKGYIICLQGIPYYHKCPPNMKFDRISQTCIPEHLSQCKNDPKFLVKTLNPNILCNNMLKKFGSKSWCDYFLANKNTIAPGTE